MLMFDPVYLIFVLPGLILALWASWYTKSTFGKYSNYESPYGLTGAQAAAQMLSSAGIDDVRIEETSGFLSDHYDPVSKTLRPLSDLRASSIIDLFVMIMDCSLSVP